jgi:hypothetical protein
VQVLIGVAGMTAILALLGWMVFLRVRLERRSAARRDTEARVDRRRADQHHAAMDAARRRRSGARRPPE